MSVHQYITWSCDFRVDSLCILAVFIVYTLRLIIEIDTNVTGLVTVPLLSEEHEMPLMNICTWLPKMDPAPSGFDSSRHSFWPSCTRHLSNAQAVCRTDGHFDPQATFSNSFLIFCVENHDGPASGVAHMISKVEVSCVVLIYLVDILSRTVFHLPCKTRGSQSKPLCALSQSERMEHRF